MSGSSSPAELQLSQASIEAIIQGVAAKLKESPSGPSAAAKQKDPSAGPSVAAKQKDSSSGPSEATESGSGPSQGKS